MSLVLVVVGRSIKNAVVDDIGIKGAPALCDLEILRIGAVAKDTCSVIAKEVKQSLKSEFTGLLREKHPRNDGSMSFTTAPVIFWDSFSEILELGLCGRRHFFYQHFILKHW